MQVFGNLRQRANTCLHKNLKADPVPENGVHFKGGKMILEFSDNNYIDVDDIRALRKMKASDGSETGVVFVGGQKMAVSIPDFKVIEKAYKWVNNEIYKYDHKKFKGDE
jgi:hypothetical protein